MASWDPFQPMSLYDSITQHSMDFIGIGIYPLTALNKRSKPQMIWICAAHRSVELPIYTTVEYGLWNKSKGFAYTHPFIFWLGQLESNSQTYDIWKPYLELHTKWNY